MEPLGWVLNKVFTIKLFFCFLENFVSKLFNIQIKLIVKNIWEKQFMKITIIGGGIGGLTVALCLHKGGYEVKVFESVKEIKPLGVGINILPHSVRVLTNLGLQDIIAKQAIETSNLEYFNRHGQRFWSEPRGRHAGYKWPQFSVHRGALQMILFKEVQDKLGIEALYLNHHLSHFEQDKDKIKAFFIDKETGKTINTVESDLLIGADGINSAVRNQLFPLEGPPVYSDNVLYRGTTVMPPFLDGKTMAMIGSLKQKMVVYPISLPDENGNSLINWVGNIKEGNSKLTVRDWNRQANQQSLVEKYKSWDFDWINVPQMIQNAPGVYEFPMSDRHPLERWSFGRVTLLGDAAHPMYPIGSNGASQAILDAEMLANSLQNESDPIKGLEAYETDRRPKTSKVVLQNRDKGPDQILDLMEELFPKGFNEEQIPHQKLADIMNNYKKIAGFDIETLNQKS
jgi:2-polyprenyl-6-methoxyphenol hydroxylase-like FAD-dependent oxidoreductase